MKLILATIIAGMSLSAFAAFTEVECHGRAGTKRIEVEVEEGFGPGFRRAEATATESGVQSRQDFTVMARGAFGNRIRYEAPGFDLEVDFWPDVRPQWAKTYRGNFSSTEMDVPYTFVWCRFPNMRP